MDEVRVVVADDDPLRRTLVRAQGLDRGVLVVAEVDSPGELRRAVATEHPDVVLLRGQLRGQSTAAVVAELAATTPVIVVDDDPDPDTALLALEAKASGVLRSDAGGVLLLDAVVAATTGGTTLDPVVATSLVTQWRELRAGGVVSGVTELTAREQQVLGAMVEGLATKAVARRFGIAVKTVENHKIRIFDKLGARTQAHAVSIAIRQGLVTPERGA